MPDCVYSAKRLSPALMNLYTIHYRDLLNGISPYYPDLVGRGERGQFLTLAQESVYTFRLFDKKDLDIIKYIDSVIRTIIIEWTLKIYKAIIFKMFIDIIGLKSLSSLNVLIFLFIIFM